MPKQPTDHAPKTKTYGIRKNALEDVDLPSGGFAQVRRPGLQGLLKVGILDSFDSLTAIVATETIPNAKGETISKPKAPDAEQVGEALAVMDRIVAYVVVQPALLPITTTDEQTGVTRDLRDDERDPDAFYIDDMEIEDKTFLVNFAMGGTRDLARFREESAAAVGSVQART